MQGQRRAGGRPSKTWCGRRDLSTHRALSPADFHAVYGFRRPDVPLLENSPQVCGLDYPFTLPRKIRSLGAARLLSTPSRLECLSRLGSGLPFEVSPEFEQFCIAGFPGEHSGFLLSPLRLPVPPSRLGKARSVAEFQLQNWDSFILPVPWFESSPYSPFDSSQPCRQLLKSNAAPVSHIRSITANPTAGWFRFAVLDRPESRPEVP
jgi:hypothetical protein